MSAIQPSSDPVQENITNWQANINPLAPLTEEQLDVIYQIEDFLEAEYHKGGDENLAIPLENAVESSIPLIDTNKAFVKWLIQAENEVRQENLSEHQLYFEKLTNQCTGAEKLFQFAEESIEAINLLQTTHKEIISKTDYLHDLSEELLKQQRILKTKSEELGGQLIYFIKSDEIRNDKNRKVNSMEFVELLKLVVSSIDNLGSKLHYKEARVYKMKNESLLQTLLTEVYTYVSDVITECSKQVTDPEKNLALVETVKNDSFAIYYGKFQSASHKVRIIINYLEENESNEHFNSTLSDCRKTYLSQRLPILNIAVSKALVDIKEKLRNDFSVLFRSCGVFTMKMCQDEATCFHYFFSKPSEQLDSYLGILCQHLYDVLRPSLISINHIESLSELCGILRRELLHEKVLNNPLLTKYVEAIRQLLQDVEERLVFRTNIFFQHDLLGYNPSGGDLAYPEKLIQMEAIAGEMQEDRNVSRSSSVSMESHEVAQINNQFRSYTGNSAADLHGMWYPTVKRTLVCLSRLYFCLERGIFQGLAQEALAICIKTVSSAADQIALNKTPIDAHLFQIKHLLIIREQIAPFQVDFTIKEMTLDFSQFQKAASDLYSHRDKIFSFSSNNALLEFLLEGTPKVKEYLIDSRKEVDKQLKFTCENFISFSTQLLVGNIQGFFETTNKFQAASVNLPNVSLREQSFASPQQIAKLVNEAQKNIKLKIPQIQRSMQLYLANRETEFILFRPIKNNVINAFIHLDQLLNASKFTEDDKIIVACPSAVQVGVLISSVSLSFENEPNKINS